MAEKDSISASLILGPPSTAAATRRFGSRMRIALSSRVPLSAVCSFSAVLSR
jgi:hypothetical protein